MVEIRSPFPASEVPRIWTWIEPFRWRVSDDYSPKTLPEFLVAWKPEQSWAVYRDGELGGCITYQQVSPIVGTAHCVFKKSFWGRKTTEPALQAAIAEMFQRCTKLSLPVMEGNKAMISLLGAIGGKKEGVLVNHTSRAGKPVNMVLMALHREAK